MAEQVGVIKIKGKIGDLSFYESKDTFQVRTKGGASAERVSRDKTFERTRENNQEFSLASQLAKKLRILFRKIILQAPDTSLNTHLISRFLKMIKADGLSSRGNRILLAPNLRLIQNFQFNSKVHLSNVFLEHILVYIDPVDAHLHIDIPEINPTCALAFPSGATSFRIITAAGVFNPENSNEHQASFIYSDYFDLQQNQEASTFSFKILFEPSQPIMALFGITFYKQVLDCTVPINDGRDNVLAIVKILNI